MDSTDSYLHCGLSKYRPVEDVKRTIEAAGVSRAVLVQHLGEYDNTYIAGIVEREPDRFAGVCLVDHTAPSAESTLRSLLSNGPFRGVRLTADTLREAPRLWVAAADIGAVIVYFAPDGIAGSAAALRSFLDARPGCRVVVTHLGNPDARQSPRFEAHRELFQLAAYPEVFLQISGMEMFASYPYEELYPLIAQAARTFGASRLLWGSNYPVVGGLQDYCKALNLLLGGKLPIPKEAISAVAGANARLLWFGVS